MVEHCIPETSCNGNVKTKDASWLKTVRPLLSHQAVRPFLRRMEGWTEGGRKNLYLAVAHPHSSYSSTDSRSNWNLECWFLWREENRRTRRKTHRERTRTNTEQTQPTSDVRSVKQTQATAMGSVRSHHCAGHAPRIVH